jgi:hypothetical protein
VAWKRASTRRRSKFAGIEKSSPSGAWRTSVVEAGMAIVESLGPQRLSHVTAHSAGLRPWHDSAIRIGPGVDGNCR